MSSRIIIIIALGIALFLLGYATGRRVGIKEGVKEGLSYAPIKLKIEFFKTAKCPVCNQQLNVQPNCDNILNQETKEKGSFYG